MKLELRTFIIFISDVWLRVSIHCIGCIENAKIPVFLRDIETQLSESVIYTLICYSSECFRYTLEPHVLTAVLRISILVQKYCTHFIIFSTYWEQVLVVVVGPTGRSVLLSLLSSWNRLSDLALKTPHFRFSSSAYSYVLFHSPIFHCHISLLHHYRRILIIFIFHTCSYWTYS
jgi:hypothetical protein